MVGDHADGHIVLVFGPVLLAGQAAHMAAQRLDGIHVKDGIHILNRRSQTLQPHAGIDILLFQFTVIAVAVIVKLGKHVVPDLHVPVAVAAHRTVRLAASILLPAVIII